MTFAVVFLVAGLAQAGPDARQPSPPPTFATPGGQSAPQPKAPIPSQPGAPPAPAPQIGPTQTPALPPLNGEKPQGPADRSSVVPGQGCPSCPTQPCPTQPCPTSSGICPAPCETQLIQRQIQVPTTVMENRIVKVTKYRPEVRQQTVTVIRQVEEIRQVPEEYTVLVPQQQVRTVTDIVQRDVVRNVQQQYTVMVPQEERRRDVRTVTRWVQVPETRMVTEMGGRWETRPLAQPYVSVYGGCSSCPAPQCAARVWVPEVIRRPVTVTCTKPVIEQVPYDYTVTTYRPETRSRVVQVRECVPQRVSRQETYTVEVPEKRTRVQQVKVCCSVPEQKTEQYTVMVPYEENVQIQVPVCRLVQQTVTVPVSTCAGDLAYSAYSAYRPVLPGDQPPTWQLNPGPQPGQGTQEGQGIPQGLGVPPAGGQEQNSQPSQGIRPIQGGSTADRFAELIFRDVVTGRTYRYPPPLIPRERLEVVPPLGSSNLLSPRLGFAALRRYGLAR